MRAVLLVTLALIWPCAACAGQAQDSFSILSEDATETSRVVSVRIDRRMTGDDLVRIANIIKDAKTNPVMRHTAGFVLFAVDAARSAPVGQCRHDAGAQGLHRRLASSRKLRPMQQSANADRRALVGSWLTELPASPRPHLDLQREGQNLSRVGQRGGPEIRR